MYLSIKVNILFKTFIRGGFFFTRCFITLLKCSRRKKNSDGYAHNFKLNLIVLCIVCIYLLCLDWMEKCLSNSTQVRKRTKNKVASYCKKRCNIARIVVVYTSNTVKSLFYASTYFCDSAVFYQMVRI